MKKELLPDFAKPYKTKGYDVRLVRGCYQLFKISSKRVEGKSYPVLTQTLIVKIVCDIYLKNLKLISFFLFKEPVFGVSHYNLLNLRSIFYQIF